MVKIVDYKVRTSRDGDPFIALVLQDGLVLVKSKETGLYYATAKKTSITSTLDEETCKSLIGQELDGTIEKTSCEPYEIIDQESGDIIVLDYRWVFVKAGETIEDTVPEGQYQEEPEVI